MLFLVYVEDLLAKLNQHGCTILGHHISTFMYADDVILVSPSISELQTMLSVCEHELELLDLDINSSKSMCLRVGKRYKEKCGSIMSKNGQIPWIQEARYLGICIVSGNKFSCNFDEAKRKFYRTSNAILGKLGKQRNPTVALHLIHSTAIPVLSYCLEALSLNKVQRMSIEHPWDRTFMKLFNTFDKQIEQQCPFYRVVYH